MSGQEPQGMLARGLSLLIALGAYPDGATVTDIARDVGLPVSTSHRLLATEVSWGFVAMDPATKKYRLGVRVFELAHRVGSIRTLAETARPIMRDVSRSTGETVQLAVLDNDKALFVEKVGTEQAVGIRGSVGRSEPLHATSTGKVLLSQLSDDDLTSLLARIELSTWTPNTVVDRDLLIAEIDRVRAQDYALADEEFDPGVRAVAVPIRDGRELVRGALCLSAPAFRAPVDDLLGWLPTLRSAAHDIGIQLTPDTETF